AGIALFFTTLFTALFPHVLISSTDPAFSITLHQAASSSYTLTVMTVVTVLLLPLVLLYQGWTLWVFRHRLAPDDLAPAPKVPAGSPGPAA
ncbi:MAG TPA: cytochrome d ubiquinol oxidase subunit II, partial [Solirubrobacteraceae bacterium]|nr:cytochrome d ubiquinol oxidase subunit II [Solirubrobacteraceae bacterium]